VYGNNGFNPALQSSNSSKRTRHGESDTAPELGSDGEDGSAYTCSSPERYLSDYDDEGWGRADHEGDMRRRMNRVRQGSEGWEMRPADWGVDLNDLERRAERPWEEEGRYRLYEPDSAMDDGEDSDGWGTSAPYGPSLSGREGLSEAGEKVDI